MKKKTTMWVAISALFLTALVFNAYYRWDLKVFSSIGYEIGMEMDWYEEQDVFLEELNVRTVAEFKKKLEQQGFVEVKEHDSNLYNGFHRKEDRLHWYTFKVSENSEVFKKEFSIAWGLCSQAAGIAISQDNRTSVRFLNPGGTCV